MIAQAAAPVANTREYLDKSEIIPGLYWADLSRSGEQIEKSTMPARCVVNVTGDSPFLRIDSQGDPLGSGIVSPYRVGFLCRIPHAERLVALESLDTDVRLGASA